MLVVVLMVVLGAMLVIVLVFVFGRLLWLFILGPVYIKLARIPKIAGDNKIDDQDWCAYHPVGIGQ